jgi:hypothetical protein
MDSDPVRYSIDVKELGKNGYEVVVSVINEGEDWLYVKGAQVEIEKDGESFGRHKADFLRTDAYGVVRLGQFEIAEGRFHLGPDHDHRTITFRVHLDYKYGDTEGETQKISRRVETQRITRPK